VQEGARGFEIQVLNVGREQAPRPIVDVPGNGRAFAVDRTGSYAAAVTDRGTYLVPLKVADPSNGMKLLGPVARDVEFGRDGALYVLEGPKLSAFSPEGALKWTQPLTDGRRIAVGIRAVVLDGTDKLVTFAPQDGTPDVLAPVGQVQDLVTSRDGRWIGVIADARRAVLFRLMSATPP
jgi:outer membrane protein assembly factor BamB